MRTVDSILDSQRKESEVRSLLQDLEKLISLKGEKRLRWVWELIQNAKDCATRNKVNVYFTLTGDKLTFEHDGEPFQIEQLIALVRKTSTKSIEGVDGNTGKFGTGFVTTHILNRKVIISGLLRNGNGCRPFCLTVDRSFDDLQNMTKSLEKAYDDIEKFNQTPPSDSIQGVRTKYEYDLEEHKFDIAKEGLDELERNISFTLLVNDEQISSITIARETEKEVSFTIAKPQLAFADIGFSKVICKGVNYSSNEEGLLFKRTPELTIAFPATKCGDNYSLYKIENQARIFRDFPLIGTERFHFPSLVHSNLFQPTEQRDGIRTLKEREDRTDKYADDNRTIIGRYASTFRSIFSLLEENRVGNLHLLAESGLPDDCLNYLAKEWFETEIQKPLRDFILQHNLVRTVDGAFIKIGDAKFIQADDSETVSELYIIASELFPIYCPDKESYKDWNYIIGQDLEKWPHGIHVSLEDIVKEVEMKDKFSELSITGDNTIEWLNRLISCVLKDKNKLDEKYAIYPNQSGTFKKRFDIKIDPGFDDEIKNIAKDICINLYDDLVSDDIRYLDNIAKFELTNFFVDINNFIGGLSIDEASQEQVTAIFRLGCYFKEMNAPKRNEWFDLTHTLLPTLCSEKDEASILREFNFEPTDKWTLKYISSLIGEARELTSFSENYFASNESSAIDWLNRFLAFVCRNDESKETAFKHAIVLTQDGQFKKPDNLFRENGSAEFDLIFKEMINDYLEEGDPLEYLIDTRIVTGSFPERDVSFLTQQIDRLFSDSEVGQAVEDGERLNSLFHKLNDWIANDKKGDGEKERLFPIFAQKRPELSVRAYGRDMSRILSEKNIDDIKALSKLKLEPQELSKLEEAANLAGGTQVLLEIAQSKFIEAEMNRWRREVGQAAELAFLDAMRDIDTNFDIENPDCGKDFTVISKTTGREFYIEIKSTVIGEETVKMSALQGATAKDEKHHYALCVITRPSGTLIDKEYFLQHAKFVPAIGELIGDKLSNILDDLRNISEHESGDDVNVTMDNKTFSVYVKKRIWEDGISFAEFIVLLQDYLNRAV